MPTYERSVRIRAPFETVWEFHSTTNGLEALTPRWMHLEIEEIRGPDGEPDPVEMVTGSTATASIRPFGVGPRQRMTTEIVERVRGDEDGYFVDEMAGGPFAHWRHTHAFGAVEGGTLLRDRVEYRLAGGPLGRAAEQVAVLGLAPMFRYRHRRTKALLE